MARPGGLGLRPWLMLTWLWPGLLCPGPWALWALQSSWEVLHKEVSQGLLRGGEAVGGRSPKWGWSPAMKRNACSPRRAPTPLSPQSCFYPLRPLTTPW